MNKELEKFATETFRESHNTKMVYEMLEDHDINDKLLELLLYDNKEEFLNDIDYHWINCIHKNDIFNVIKALSENVSALERHHLEYRIKRKDGSYL